MKNLLLILALSLPSALCAQILKVGSVEKLSLPDEVYTSIVGISPQGDYVLLSSKNNKGLVKMNLKNHSTQTISTASGAGYEVQISPDGNHVVYREDTYTPAHLRMISLKVTDLTSRQSSTLAGPSRDLQGYGINASSATVVTKGKAHTKAFGAAKTLSASTILSISNRQLMLTRNGKTSVFSPNGKDYSYIWPSLSPNGKKALYYVCGNGAYVCNLDGTHIQPLGSIRAPRWYDDNTVVGMNDKDNGEFVTSSSIVAVSLQGDHQVLTGDSIIAMYPYANASGSIITFSTPEGNAYIINITK